MVLMQVFSPKPILTEKEVKEKLEIADIDGNGNLSMKELKNVFKEMGSDWPLIRAFLGMQKADSDGDGKISASEKEKLVSYIMKWYHASN